MASNHLVLTKSRKWWPELESFQAVRTSCIVVLKAGSRAASRFTSIPELESPRRGQLRCPVRSGPVAVGFC